MRFLFCGSRDLEDSWAIWNDLQKIVSVYDTSDLTIIHGGARGADDIAGYYGTKLGLNVEAFPADWDRFKKAAGHIRNQAMLDSGVDAVFAYVSKPLAESTGTANMVKIARAADVTVHIRECF